MPVRQYAIGLTVITPAVPMARTSISATAPYPTLITDGHSPVWPSGQ
jgi:hypothetical protein